MQRQHVERLIDHLLRISERAPLMVSISPRTASSSLYPSLPLSKRAEMMSHALLCLPPSSSSIHDDMSRAPANIDRRAQVAPSRSTSSSVNDAISSSSRPATAARKHVASLSSNSRIFVLLVLERLVASIR